VDTIPMQLDQLLTLALGVVFVTQGLKAIAGRIGGSGAVIVSAVVAVALTALAYGAGWVPVSIPACDPQTPLACVQGWPITAGGALALANLLYAAVYRRVLVEPIPT
jgi:hypothetical protein